MFAAGALAAVGPMNIWILAFTLFIAAVLGDTVNYTIGSKYGRMFTDRFLKPEYVAKTEQYYQEFGGRTGKLQFQNSKSHMPFNKLSCRWNLECLIDSGARKVCSDCPYVCAIHSGYRGHGISQICNF